VIFVIGTGTSPLPVGWNLALTVTFVAAPSVLG
jgi:hypothetical protein